MGKGKASRERKDMESADVSTIAAGVAAVLTISLEVMALIGSAVWVVSKIQATTLKLTSEISHLSDTVRGLHEDISRLYDDLGKMQTKIAVIENRDCGKQPMK